MPEPAMAAKAGFVHRSSSSSSWRRPLEVLPAIRQQDQASNGDDLFAPAKHQRADFFQPFVPQGVDDSVRKLDLGCLEEVAEHGLGDKGCVGQDLQQVLAHRDGIGKTPVPVVDGPPQEIVLILSAASTLDAVQYMFFRLLGQKCAGLLLLHLRCSLVELKALSRRLLGLVAVQSCEDLLVAVVQSDPHNHFPDLFFGDRLQELHALVEANKTSSWVCFNSKHPTPSTRSPTTSWKVRVSWTCSKKIRFGVCSLVTFTVLIFTSFSASRFLPFLPRWCLLLLLGTPLLLPGLRLLLSGPPMLLPTSEPESSVSREPRFLAVGFAASSPSSSSRSGLGWARPLARSLPMRSEFSNRDQVALLLSEPLLPCRTWPLKLTPLISASKRTSWHMMRSMFSGRISSSLVTRFQMIQEEVRPMGMPMLLHTSTKASNQIPLVQ
mmetsp:Transcript_77573/g.139955  ORF Transcript_77573/g.139955 Transcript_77573/m.139955 type:complete len:437 (+) Transcript_77573:722-2032(+)